MGILINFYAGDPVRIATAVASRDSRTLQDRSVVLGVADFSIHITPDDLDALSREAAQLAGLETVGYHDSLATNLGGNRQESSIELMTDKWVQLFASLEENQARDLAARWMKALSETYEQTMEVSEDAVRSISELNSLCKIASKRGVSVVNTWCL